MYLDVGYVGGGDDFLEITQGVGLGERVDQLVLDDGLLDLNTGHAEVRHKLLEGPVTLCSLDDLCYLHVRRMSFYFFISIMVVKF